MNHFNEEKCVSSTKFSDSDVLTYSFGSGCPPYILMRIFPNGSWTVSADDADQYIVGALYRWACHVHPNQEVCISLPQCYVEPGDATSIFNYPDLLPCALAPKHIEADFDYANYGLGHLIIKYPNFSFLPPMFSRNGDFDATWGQVDISPDQLSILSTDKFKYLLNYADKHVQAIADHFQIPGPINLYHPALRYSICTALLHKYPNNHDLRAWECTLLRELVWKGTRCEAQYGMAEIRASIVHASVFIARVAHRTMDFPRRFMGAVLGALDSCGASFGLGFVAGIAQGFSAFWNDVLVRLSSLGKTIKDVAIKCFPLFKTLIRYFLGYKPECLALELIFEDVVYTNVFKWVFEGAVPQAGGSVDSILLLLGGLVSVLLGKVEVTSALPKFLKALSDCYRSLDTIGFVKHLSALRAWITGDHELILFYELPEDAREACINLRLTALQYQEDLTFQSANLQVSKENLAKCYAHYLKFAHVVAPYREISVTMKIFCDIASGAGTENANIVRPRPAVFMLFGGTNVGKSHLINVCARTVAKYFDVPGNNPFYAVNLGDAYTSGYAHQPVWLFDEWLQGKDTETNPNPSIKLLFDLVSTTPCRLNMAALSDKGMIATVNIVLGATNVDLSNDDTLNRLVKCIHDIPALASRLSHRVKVELNTGFVISEGHVLRNGNPIIEPTIEDYNAMYRLTLFTPTDGGRKYAGKLICFSELITAMIRSYKNVVAGASKKPTEFSGYFGPAGDLKWISNHADSHSESSSNDSESTDVESDCPFSTLSGVSASETAEFSDAVVLSGDPKGKTEVSFVPEMMRVRSLWNYVTNLFPTTPNIYYAREKIWIVESLGKYAVPKGRVCLDNGRRDLMFCLRSDASDHVDADGLLQLDRCHYGYYVDDDVEEEFDLLTGLVSALFLAAASTTVVAVSYLGGCFLYNRFIVVQNAISDYFLDTSDDSIIFPRLEKCDDDDIAQAGTFVTRDGKTYYVYQKKSGAWKEYEVQSGSVSSLYRNQRLAAQIPIVANNLFHVSAGHGVGNLIAVTGSDLLGPGHVVKTFDGGNFTLVGAHGFRLTVPQGSYSVDYLTDDAAFVRLSNPLHKVRDISKKIAPTVPATGSAVRLYRDGYGELHEVSTTFVTANTDISYDGGHCKKAKAFMADATGFQGLCGAIYVLNHQAPTQFILGFHIAAKLSGQTVFRGIFDCTRLTHNCLPAVDDTSALAKVYGKHGDAFTGSPYMEQGSLGTTFVPQVEALPKYAVADLRVPAIIKGINKMATATKVVLPDLKQVSDAIVDYYCRLLQNDSFKEHMKTFTSIPDLDDVVNSHWLPSLDRSKASGFPYCREVGSTKAAMFLTPAEAVELGLDPQRLHLYPTVKHMLGEMASDLAFGETVPVHFSAFPKEEPRLVEKVEAQKTRIASVVPFHEFILERQYFYGLADLLAHFSTAAFSAFGVPPEEFKKIHDIFVQEMLFVAAFDFEGMDQSFFTEILGVITEIIVRICCLDKVDQNRVASKIRRTLIKRLASAPFIFGGDEVRFDVAHPSGSFLTAILNHFADLIVFVYSLSKVLKISPATVMRTINMLFLGDDSLIASRERYDPKLLFKYAKELGFTLTSSTKSDDLSLEPVWEPKYGTKSTYTFLGRHFTVAGGALGLDRLNKTLPFAYTGKMLDVFPDKVLALREELMVYHNAGLTQDLSLCYELFRWLELSCEELLTISVIDLKSRVINYLHNHPESLIVKVPKYNQGSKFVAQGSGKEEEPEHLGDATILTSDQSVVLEDTAKPLKLIYENIDPVNYAPVNVFERPIRISTGMTGTAANTVLQQVFGPSSYFVENPAGAAKLRDFAWFRCVVCVKVVLASGPYASGKLFLAMRYGPNLRTNAWMAAADHSVELDVASARSAVLKAETVLPWGWSLVERFSTLPTTFQNFFDFCSFSLVTVTGISTSVPYSIFMWLEDPDLRGPSPSPWVGEVGNKQNVTTKAPSCSSSSHNRSGAPAPKPSFDMARAEWQWRNEHTPEWLQTVGASVSTIGGMIASVEKAILGPVGSSIAGHIATFAGFSAPPVDTHKHIVSYNPSILSTAVVDAPVPSYKLATTQSQRIIPDQCIFGTDEDEMAILNYARHWGLVGMIIWSGVHSQGHTLAVWNVMPGLVTFVEPWSTSDLIEPTPIASCSAMFNFWTGAIRYKLSIAKTTFHTGMLEIIYQMGEASAPVATRSDVAACPRFLWDVSVCPVFQFEIPYSSPMPWSRVLFHEFGEGPRSRVDMMTGQIIIKVVNPLTDAGGVVASSIPMLLYIAAGDDFELALPGFAPQVDMGFVNTNYPNYIPEGGSPVLQNTEMSVEDANCVYRFRPSGPRTVRSHLATVGERIISLRLLTRRLSGFVDLDPGVYGMEHVMFRQKYMKFMSGMYAAYVGGFRVVPYCSANAEVIANSYLAPQGRVHASWSTANQTNPTFMANPSQGQRGYGIDVPYQSPLFFSYLCSASAIAATSLPDFNKVTVGGNLAAIAFSAADDFTFGIRRAPAQFAVLPIDTVEQLSCYP